MPSHNGRPRNGDPIVGPGQGRGELSSGGWDQETTHGHTDEGPADQREVGAHRPAARPGGRELTRFTGGKGFMILIYDVGVDT